MADGVSVLASLQGRTLAAAVAAVPKAPKPTLGRLPGEMPAQSSLASVATPAVFPNDAPLEVVVGIIAGLERERAHLTEVIDALRLLAGDPVAITSTLKQEAQVAQKNMEREADRRAAKGSPAMPAAVVTMIEARDRKRALVLESLVDEPGTALPNMVADEDFATRMARLQAEAQAKTFTAAVAAADAGGGPVEVMKAAMAAAAWACPIHGLAIEKTSPRRGTVYHACPFEGCQLFERL